MTISSTVRKVIANGNGVATVFSFSPLTIFESSDLVVVLTDAAGNETTLAEGTGSTNYSVSVTAYPGTGSITYPASGGTPLPAGSTLTMRPVLSLTQDVALSNQGGYFADVQEEEFDRLTVMLQQMQEQIDRSLKTPTSDATSPRDLPTAANRANQALLFDTNGDVIAGQISNAPVSAAMQPVVAGATLPAARTALGLGAAAVEALDAAIVDDGAGNLTVKANGIVPAMVKKGSTLGDDGTGELAVINTWEPQLRLTLTSGKPVMMADVVGAATVYYTPFVGDMVPIFNGTIWVPCHTNEISVALSAAQQLQGNIYDLFVYLKGGVPTLGVGPAWSAGGGSNTARGAGAGSTAINRQNGIWVSTNAINLWDGAAADNVAAGQATYVGSVYTVANGQTSAQFKPAAAAGGPNAMVVLFNAYRRTRFYTRTFDSTANWTYAGGSGFRPENGSQNNRINFLDGLGVVSYRGQFTQYGAVPAGGTMQIGVLFDAIAGTPGGVNGLFGTSAGGGTITGGDSFIGQGLHYAQAMEDAVGGTVTFYSNGLEAELLLTGEM